MFAFGKNWKVFVRDFLDDGRIAEAEKSLSVFLGLKDMSGKSFLDIGCGSGLFSLAARRLGASRIVSFDVDADSVECCRFLKEREGNPAEWTVTHGSVLDPAFLNSLGRFDIVYSWGVLHHTGRMWQAIENAGGLVADSGLFYIAIYNRAEGWRIHPDGRIGPSTFWESEKRLYCGASKPFQRFMCIAAMSGMFAAYALTFNNPFRKIREHAKLRGMAWSVDIADWLGGFPYEYATAVEVSSFCGKRLGFRLERLISNDGLLNNEFLFRRTSQASRS